MNFSRFFIDRPIFAAVIAIVITLIGAFAFPLLPLSQYPEIAPPTIVIQAPYPGASSETIAETVAAPLEQEINGVENMLYIQSSSTQGQSQITVTFEPGTDLDAAQVLVQNRVRLAEPRLPEQVRQVGVTVAKQQTGFLLIATLTAEEGSGLDIDYVGNYAQTVIRDRLLRLPGVGGVNVFGGGSYSMRIWIDPDRAAGRDLTSTEIVAALRAQNVQVAGGALGQSPNSANPAFEVPVDVQGRLATAEEFAQVVLKSDPATGSITRLGDVARVELGNQDYGIRAFYNGGRSVA
ncbi:MAG TPA: efflux RND transporter permease subunit, partial [Croceibacterium sp.]|nr:efflux RND transporter permease subunit [Croceibacterium sp.]